MTTTTLVHAGLRAVLPGTWVRADAPRATAAATNIHEALGARLATAAPPVTGHAERSAWVCTGDTLHPGMALLTARPDMVMAPALGTSADAVLDIMERALRRRDVPGSDAARRIPTLDSAALAITAVEPVPGSVVAPFASGSAPDSGADRDEPAGLDARRAVLDYYVARPGSKAVVWVRIVSPLGTIPHQVAAHFDRACRGWRFA